MSGHKTAVPRGVKLILLPQLHAKRYYSYSPKARQYGTLSTIKTLIEITETIKFDIPGVSIGIGDNSFQAGGPMVPHKSHRHGRHVDIRPLRLDAKKLPVAYTDVHYSRELTKRLVQALLAHRNVKTVLLNDVTIAGVTPFDGHHNHLHVKMHL